MFHELGSVSPEDILPNIADEIIGHTGRAVIWRGHRYSLGPGHEADMDELFALDHRGLILEALERERAIAVMLSSSR